MNGQLTFEEEQKIINDGQNAIQQLSTIFRGRNDDGSDRAENSRLAEEAKAGFNQLMQKLGRADETTRNTTKEIEGANEKLENITKENEKLKGLLKIVVNEEEKTKLNETKWGFVKRVFRRLSQNLWDNLNKYIVVVTLAYIVASILLSKFESKHEKSAADISFCDKFYSNETTCLVNAKNYGVSSSNFTKINYSEESAEVAYTTYYQKKNDAEIMFWYYLGAALFCLLVSVLLACAESRKNTQMINEIFKTFDEKYVVVRRERNNNNQISNSSNDNNAPMMNNENAVNQISNSSNDNNAPMRNNENAVNQISNSSNDQNPNPKNSESHEKSDRSGEIMIFPENKKS